MKIDQIIDEMQASLTKLRGKMRLMGTAGECYCHHSLVKSKCLLCDPTPDLPLHAKVAKALGKELYQDGMEEWREYCNEEHIFGPLIPDYDTDLTAAMGALEGYGIWYSAQFWKDNGGCKNARITLEHSQNFRDCKIADFPQAICEAIVAHAETQ